MRNVYAASFFFLGGLAFIVGRPPSSAGSSSTSKAMDELLRQSSRQTENSGSPTEKETQKQREARLEPAPAKYQRVKTEALKELKEEGTVWAPSRSSHQKRFKSGSVRTHLYIAGTHPRGRTTKRCDLSVRNSAEGVAHRAAGVAAMRKETDKCLRCKFLGAADRSPRPETLPGSVSNG